jgi:ribokinase
LDFKLMKVLAIGDINVDIMLGGLASLPVVDREVHCESFEITVGSTAAIFACAYASLGGDVSFLGLAGLDDYGDFMLKSMKSFGIDTSLVRRTDRVKTGVTVNLIYGNTRSQVTYPGTIAEFSGEDIDGEVLEGFDHIHFAGPFSQKKFRPHIERLLGLAANRGASTSLDTQWDPQETWEGLERWLPLLDYLFVNQDEALSISKMPDIEAACRWLAARTPFPLVKVGAEGAWLVIEGEPRRIPSFPVEVVDTTGAGDSFDAAFLFADRIAGMPPLEAARFATAAAARSCRFVGGVAARSSYQDVRDFCAGRDPVSG